MAFVVGASSCANRDENQVVEPAVVGMTSNLAALYEDGEMSLYQVAVPVRLPMRAPTGEEAGALGQAQAPLPREPFLRARDARITIRFTITNLDDAAHNVELLLDPWNEFVRYRPGIQIDEEEAIPNFSGFDKFFVVGPKQRYVGTITPDDCTEMAIDLATAHLFIDATPPDVENVNGYVNHLFNPQNRSSDPSPLVAPFIAKEVPGLVGFDLGLRSYEPANLAVEVIVDVEDLHGDRILPVDDDEYTPMPIPDRILEPPAAMD